MIGISGYGNSPLTGYIYGGYGIAPQGSAEAGSGEKAGAIKNPGESTRVAPGRRSSPAECQTCKERKYQDGSDENVSFKSAQHISPEAAAARVRGHEQEHVANAYSKAAQNGGKVINASVAIHTAVCPECGRTYVSGGTTHTMIKYNNEKNPYQQNKKANDALGLRGQSVDLAV
ncbi:MAG: hypothetical protein IKO16_03895 [Lachnospiraceae bacterium]|nr:hypothetical protein [Lachnospiraceae bacterium]